MEGAHADLASFLRLTVEKSRVRYTVIEDQSIIPQSHTLSGRLIKAAVQLYQERMSPPAAKGDEKERPTS